MKIYIQFPWKIKDSNYYKYLKEFPPKGINYINKEKEEVIINKKKLSFLLKTKKLVRMVSEKIKISLPNAYFTKKKINCDLIHCAHCLSLNKNKPWVADFESFWQMYIGESSSFAKNRIKKILKSQNCKKIIPWTETTKKEILEEYPEVKNKVKVVYPAVPIPKYNKKKNKKITILYVSRYFWIKGGLIALETLKNINKKHNVEIIFICDVPKNIKLKYPEIKTVKPVNYKKLISYYKKTDILFYPSFVDTFGFTILEAMSYKIPIVALKTRWTKAIHEIIKDKKNGFLIEIPGYFGSEHPVSPLRLKENEKEVSKKLERKLSLLIKNEKLREKMSENCIKEIEKGKFSIKKRNKDLEEIYREAISNK